MRTPLTWSRSIGARTSLHVAGPVAVGRSSPAQAPGAATDYLLCSRKEKDSIVEEPENVEQPEDREHEKDVEMDQRGIRSKTGVHKIN
ncbi:hypothetical protein BS78_05G191200 [Paspalum vaginatum]|nr:hypothetical protein BS78_05G191200 [Paspalum vaginatum]